MKQHPYIFSYETDYLMGNARQFTHKMDYNYIVRQIEQPLSEIKQPLSILLVGDRLPGCYAALGEYFQKYPSFIVWKAQNQEECMVALAQDIQFVIFVGYLAEEGVYTIFRKARQNGKHFQTILFAGIDDCTRQIRRQQQIDFLYDRREPVAGLVALMLQANMETKAQAVKLFKA